MATAVKEDKVDMESYKSDPIYRAIMNMIHVPLELEKSDPDDDDYTSFFENEFVQLALDVYGTDSPVSEGPMAEPMAESVKKEPSEALKEALDTSRSKKQRQKRALVKRAETTNEQIELYNSIYRSVKDSMKIGDAFIQTYQVGDIPSETILLNKVFTLPKGSGKEILTLNPTNRITLKQRVKISNVIVIDLKFIGESNSSLFNNVHISFWPRKSIPSGNPLHLSKKNFTLFRKGSIHIVLQNVMLGNEYVYIKVRLDDKTKKFIITDEDYASLHAFKDEDNDNGVDDIIRFIELIVDILNYSIKDFFPALGAKLFRKRKSKRKSKRKTKKRKTKKKKTKKK